MAYWDRFLENLKEAVNWPSTSSLNFTSGTLKVGGVAVAAGAAIPDVTATAAEINKLAGVTGGTTAASKALVVGADKNLDVLALASLRLGAGAGTAITAEAAEINLIDGAVAGTSVASKALALGASKNTDILGLPVGGLKIGAAGAEVALTPTAAEFNKLAGSGAKVASGTQNANLTALKADYAKTDIDDAGTIDGTEIAVVLNLLAARCNALDVCLEAFGINLNA